MRRRPTAPPARGLCLMEGMSVEKSDRSPHRRATGRVGVLTALVLVIGSGFGYRLAAGRLARAQGSVPLPRGTLAALPMAIDDWTGRDVPLTDAVVAATDTDDHLNRRYVRSTGLQEVSLFIGYGIRIRDLMPHRPEVCYTGAGWALDDTKQVSLSLVDGTDLPSQVQRFRRGGLDTRRITVLNYYIVDGEYCSDVSLLRSKAWKPRSSVAYVAQVQIASGDDALHRSGEAGIRRFAADSAPAIRRLLAEATAQAAAQP